MNRSILVNDIATATTLRTPTIAIIGMEGAGKTVLTATLAKRLSSIDSRGMFLNPQGVKTLKYVERVWQTLQSGDWPPSTPPGELFELSWKLQIVGEMECNVRLVDAAGQDLRLLFGDEQIHAMDSLPAHLHSLAEYCRSAEIMLFLINLRDLVGEGNAEQKIANEAAIKSAMDYLSKSVRPHRLCLVLTQTDLYKALAEEKGGWLELISVSAPYVFGAHLRSHHVGVFPISAVVDTKVVVDTEGSVRRVPVAGFRSEGLDELINWLADQVKGVKKEILKKVEETPLPPRSDPPPVPASSAIPTAEPANTSFLRYPLFIAFILVIAFISYLVSGGTTSKSPPAPPPQVTFKWGVTWGDFNDDIWVQNTSSITLTNVKITVERKKDGKLAYSPIVLNVGGLLPGERKDWVNIMSIPRNSIDNTSTLRLECDQNR